LANGDLDAAAHETHDYLRKFVFPSTPPNFPWVIYHVYSTGPENVEEIIANELDQAVWLGADMFHHDASWYLGSSTEGTGDWGSGLGNYSEHPQKFPNGLARVSQEIHRRGMKFGLWVDPVVVDSRLVGNKIPPNWIARWDDKDNGLTIKTWAAPVNQLCVGNPEVKEHLKKELSSVVERYGVDWIKWDNSALGAYPYCNRADHGHQKGDGSYRNVLNIYEIRSYLHDRFPNLVLEQCGYGSRLDYGLARYARANWLTDALAGGKNNLASLARSTVLAAAYVFPSAHNLSGVAVGSEIDLPSGPAILDSIFRSRMVGLFRVATPRGRIADRFSQWRPEVREAARRNVAVFKKYRHLLSQDIYHLRFPDAEARQWSVAEFCARDGSEAVLLCFRGTDPQETMLVKPKGLVDSATYRILSYNTGHQCEAKARLFCRDGLRVELADAETSEILHIFRQNFPTRV
jgi:alpha-galactosidase